LCSLEGLEYVQPIRRVGEIEVFYFWYVPPTLSRGFFSASHAKQTNELRTNARKKKTDETEDYSGLVRVVDTVNDIMGKEYVRLTKLNRTKELTEFISEQTDLVIGMRNRVDVLETDYLDSEGDTESEKIRFANEKMLRLGKGIQWSGIRQRFASGPCDNEILDGNDRCVDEAPQRFFLGSRVKRTTPPQLSSDVPSLVCYAGVRSDLVILCEYDDSTRCMLVWLTPTDSLVYSHQELPCTESKVPPPRVCAPLPFSSWLFRKNLPFQVRRDE
jgi:hypothetical protein